MKIALLTVGKTTDKHFSAAIDDYRKRTKRYVPFSIEIIPDIKNTKSLSAEQQKEKEGECILRAIQPGDVVILLDEHGQEMRSVEFAAYLNLKMSNATGKRLLFVIGGPYGFSKSVYHAAHEKVSLSKMTFSHQMIRLLFIEQLYRALSILHGSPYHHE